MPCQSEMISQRNCKHLEPVVSPGGRQCWEESTPELSWGRKVWCLCLLFSLALCFLNKMRTEVNFGPGMNKKEYFVLLFILRQKGNSPGCANVFVGEKQRCGNPVTAGKKGVIWGRYKIVQDSLAPLLVTGPETEDPNYDIMTLFIKIFNRTDTRGCGSEDKV